MKVLGLIVEYNPFHNGHIYHIEESKKLINPDYTIAIMSSSFVQRGEPAIIDKWTRAKLAVEFGVDLVVELPFVFACQSADYFAYGSVKILNELGVTDLCFGSETGNIDQLYEIANAIYNDEDQYNTYVKRYLAEGRRYPDACNLALETMLGHVVTTPNDILGLAYVKEIVKHNYNMQAHCLKRTNQFHNKDIQAIASATALRYALKNNKECSIALPHSELYQNHLCDLSNYYSLLKYVISMSSVEELSTYHLVDEGIEYLLKDQINKTDNMFDFVDSLLSKRYTRPRIQRMLIHILMKNKKEDILTCMEDIYARFLCMNKNGQAYLNRIKKDSTIPLLSQYVKDQYPALTLEAKATTLLSFLYKNQNDVIKEEFSHHPFEYMNSLKEL